MRVKIYLDTSIVSAYFDERNKERCKITKKWWAKKLLKCYEVFISELVEEELLDTKDEKRKDELLLLVKNIKRLQISEEVLSLAEEYVRNEIIPEDYRDDAIHIALATVNEIFLIASWNFKHMVNYDVKRKVKAINILKGYREVEIESPIELGGGEDD